MKYLCKLHWSWGNQSRFQEVYEFSVKEKGEVDEAIRSFIVRMSRRYAFDCGRAEYPLNPIVSSLEIIPHAEVEQRDLMDYQPILDAEVAWTEQLIHEGNLYAGSGYNLTPSPTQPRPE